MSGRIVGEVMHHAPEDLPQLDYQVLLCLAEDAHDKDRTARKECSAEMIAYKVRPPSTAASVRQALKRLKDRALIRPVHAKPSRGHQQNWIIAKLSSYHREGARIIPLKRDFQKSRNPPDPDDAESVTSGSNA